MFKLLFLSTWEAIYWPTDSGNVRVASRKATMLEYRAFLQRHIHTGRHIYANVAVKTCFKINHFYSFNFTKIKLTISCAHFDTEGKFCTIFCRMEVINPIVWPLLHWQVPFQKSPRWIIFKISRSAAPRVAGCTFHNFFESASIRLVTMPAYFITAYGSKALAAGHTAN